MYTFVRADDDTRLVIPNEKLASDTIHNSTIVEPGAGSRDHRAGSMSADLEHVIDLLRSPARASATVEVFVTSLDGDATITRARARVRRPVERRARSSTSSACAPTSGCAQPGVCA